jgi:hypothetical protein
MSKAKPSLFEDPSLYAIPSEVITVILLVTPKMANDWLTNRNKLNRPLNQRCVRYLEIVLKEGHWVISHQGIAFGADGNLYDGQHRLQAIANTGISAKVMVTFNLSREACEVIDRNRTRRPGDNLVMMGGPALGSTKAGWLGAIWDIPLDMRGKSKLEAGHLATLAERYEDGLEAASEAFKSVNLPGLFRAPIVAAFIYAYATNPTKVKVMMNQYKDGNDLTKDSPILALRNYASKSRGTGSTEREADFLTTSGMIYAYIKGEPRTIARENPTAVATFALENGDQDAHDRIKRKLEENRVAKQKDTPSAGPSLEQLPGV